MIVEQDYKIYSLECPITKKIMYVGKTRLSLSGRLLNHIVDKSNKDKYDWISGLLKSNKIPKISTLTNCAKKDADFWEKEWIDFFLRHGNKLFNRKKSDGFGKAKTSWQISQQTLDKVKKQAKKDKVAVQVAAEELILKGLEK